ncbi:MAG: alpha/beta hydrolase [Waddliaceae bacterium]
MHIHSEPFLKASQNQSLDFSQKVRLSHVSEFALRVTEIALAALIGVAAFGLVSSTLLIAAPILLGSLLFGEFATPYLPQTLQRSIQWIKGTGKELLLHLFFHSIELESDEIKNPHPKEIKGNLPLIVGVHGHFSDSSAWSYVRQEVSRLEYPFISFSSSKTWSSIGWHNHEMKHLIKDYTEHIEKYGAIFLGHSMGGITASQVGLELSENERFRGKITVITLASPLEGTKVASLSPGKRAREMERGSLYLQELSERIRKAATIRFYHFASDVDCVIIPHSSARCSLPRTSPNVHTFNHIGHSGILYSDTVIDRVIEVVNRESAHLLTQSMMKSPKLSPRKCLKKSLNARRKINFQKVDHQANQLILQ